MHFKNKMRKKDNQFKNLPLIILRYFCNIQNEVIGLQNTIKDQKAAMTALNVKIKSLEITNTKSKELSRFYLNQN